MLSHIDVQAEVAERYPGAVATMFQSLAGTDDCNKICDVTIPKIVKYARSKQGERYGLYFETGQGSEFTNGAANGVDMMVLESRKYGFSRAVGAKLAQVQPRGAWLHVNDVAGFIGPEVFKSREQLVRCCLEDIVMGKLHGLPIGLDICSTLHMSVSLEDLDWCQDQIMPANPVHLIALPTKNDPMLGYLSTSFQDHVRLREKFGYKVDDAMWEFYQRIGIVDQDGKRIGETLFEGVDPNSFRGILHIIGERPGTMHHAYSVYITVAKGKVCAEKAVDHDITKLVSNIADTSLRPTEAAREILTIIREVVGKNVAGSRRVAT